MRTLSVKRGFETDHSSTQTKYIIGFTVTCDYDWWTCEFEMPYKKMLYDKIKKYETYGDYELGIEMKGKVILIAVTVHLDYSAILPDDDPFIAFANACAEIKENILEGDFTDLDLLQAYVEDEARFKKLESTSGIKHTIEKNC